MHKQYLTIKEVSLNNNCPECYSKTGLQLTFKQEFIETKLHKTLTQNVSTNLRCDTCNTEIFPVRWTEDIERVYNYQMRAFKPKRSYLKLKPLTFILLLIGIAVIAAIVTFLLYR